MKSFNEMILTVTDKSVLSPECSSHDQPKLWLAQNHKKANGCIIHNTYYIVFPNDPIVHTHIKQFRDIIKNLKSSINMTILKTNIKKIIQKNKGL